MYSDLCFFLRTNDGTRKKSFAGRWGKKKKKCRSNNLSHFTSQGWCRNTLIHGYLKILCLNVKITGPSCIYKPKQATHLQNQQNNQRYTNTYINSYKTDSSNFLPGKEARRTHDKVPDLLNKRFQVLLIRLNISGGLFWWVDLRKKNSVVLDFVLTDKGKQCTRSYLNKFRNVMWLLLRYVTLY